ncbi:MAG: ABC transporter permease [Bacteroidetes bacterium]|nr:ABC transporter permease [Bacteroidota bacterium]
MLRNYLKTALRNFWKNKTYSSLNLFGLAIGIACAGLVFLWVEDEMSFDTMYSKRDRINFVLMNWEYPDQTRTLVSTSALMAPALKAEIPGIAKVCRIDDESQNRLFSVGDKVLYSWGRYVDTSFFGMMDAAFVEGNAKSAFPQLYSILLTEKAAIKFFGTTQHVVGKTVRMDHKQDFVVTGILKDLPTNATLQYEWLMPFDLYFKENKQLDNWGNDSPLTMVEVQPGANVATINKQLHSFIQSKQPKSIARAFLFPMKDWRLRWEFANGKQTGGGRITYVYLFSVIAWIILLIACINFMNLATARSEKRGREVGVRKVLGAEKGRLVAQFIAEALLMSLLAAFVAVMLVSVALPAFNLLVEKQLLLDLLRPAHLVFLVSIVLVCGLVAGSYPSLYLSSFNPVTVLKGLKIQPGGAAFIRKGLVVLQFTVSIVLIIGTVIIFQQIEHIKSRNLGFTKDHVLEVGSIFNVNKYFPVVKQELLNTGVVENASLADHTIIHGGNNTDDLRWAGKDPSRKELISIREVGPELTETMGMKIVDGRGFTINDSAGGPDKYLHLLVTETLAKHMGPGSAVGKIIMSGDSSYQGVVVGVVKDYVYGDMYGQPDPVVFLCHPQVGGFLYVKMRASAHPEQDLAKVEAVMKKVNPGYPFDYRWVDEQFNAMFNNEVLISKLSRVFAALAIFISCLGLFGLAAFTAERRTKEIGIRKVLGASVGSIARLLSVDFLKLVVVSNLVAFPVAWMVMDNWLKSYAYRVAIHGWVFVVAGVAAVLIALVTVSFQAVKAGVANPVKSIKAE